MERKLNKKRVIIVGAAVLALLLIIGGCITLFTSCGGSKKSKTQPLLCEEPAFPATLKANGGEYTRKLSTYWWVKDVKNGIITCDNRDVHFTDKGYIATWHVEGNSSTYNYYNMGGNCLASLDTITPESNEKFGEAAKSSDKDSAKITDKVSGKVEYFGKYAVVSETDSKDKNKNVNTCVYEFKPAA